VADLQRAQSLQGEDPSSLEIVERQAGAPAVSDARLARNAAALELELAGGHRLRIGAGFDAVLLRRVVEALSSC
jgi:hypothetical protein